MGVGRIDRGSSLPVLRRGPQSQASRRSTVAVPTPRRVLVGTTVDGYPGAPRFGADRLRAAYGLEPSPPPPLVDVLA